MKVTLNGVLDRFIPPFIGKLDRCEELDRARVLVGVLLVVLVIAVVTLMVVPSTEAETPFSLPLSTFHRWLNVLAFALALLLFRFLGNFNLSGNILAAASLLSVLTAAEGLPSEYRPYALITILATPPLVGHITSYRWGVAWFAIVGVSPFVLTAATGEPLHPLWLSSWFTCLSTLFFVFHISHYYREKLVQRLRDERAHFEHAASHDPLTGLANRATFERTLSECIRTYQQTGDCAVLAYIDLDQFKPINDNHGHHVGDQVLTTIGHRLRAMIRRADTVARVGGDEFAIVFGHCTVGDIEPLLERIKREVCRPVVTEGLEVTVSCSMGVVACPADGLDPEKLYLTADRRMYEAKQGSQGSREAAAGK